MGKGVKPEQNVNVWWDKKGDLLEVTWGESVISRSTGDDRSTVSLDEDGNIVGVSIFGLGQIGEPPTNLNLSPTPDDVPENANLT